jgi:hypothetical protein
MSTAVLEIATPTETSRAEKLTATLAKAAQEKEQLDAELQQRADGWENQRNAVEGARARLQSARDLRAATEAWLAEHVKHLTGTADGHSRHSEAGRIMREWGSTKAGLPALEVVIAELEKQLADVAERARKFAEQNSIACALWPQELLG